MDFGAVLAFHHLRLTFPHISTTLAIARSHQLMMVMVMMMMMIQSTMLTFVTFATFVTFVTTLTYLHTIN